MGKGKPTVKRRACCDEALPVRRAPFLLSNSNYSHQPNPISRLFPIYQACETLCSGSSFFGTQYGQEVRLGGVVWRVCIIYCSSSISLGIQFDFQETTLFLFVVHKNHEVAPKECLGDVVGSTWSSSCFFSPSGRLTVNIGRERKKQGNR